MKKIFLLIAIISTAKLVSQVRCCAKNTSTEAFAMLTHDKNFLITHLEPLPFVLTNPIGKNIAFKCADGMDAYGYEIKADEPSTKYVFVIHEWWGLNDHIKRESEKWFHTLGNVNVIAIDLFDKQVTDNRDSAAKYSGTLKHERAVAIIKGALAYVGTKADIATVGWCFGGGWSLQASLLAGKQAKACVMFYGSPEEDISKLSSLKAPVFFIRAEQDQWINQEVVNKFEANMMTVKKSLRVKSYNAYHAFANPSNPKFNKDFSEDAYKRATNFVKSYLK